ncbi:hypothetical protein KHA80_04085 [Anaerobacillus sp. HL2]|nr:hypothetical protein KHA80_04085 [Anaerobacillus sp. HL2]
MFLAESGFNLLYSPDKVQVQISNPMYEEQIGYSKASKSKHFVIISARVINVGKSTSCQSVVFTLIDKNGEVTRLDYASFDIAVLE